MPRVLFGVPLIYLVRAATGFPRAGSGLPNVKLHPRKSGSQSVSAANKSTRCIFSRSPNSLASSMNASSDSFCRLSPSDTRNSTTRSCSSICTVTLVARQRATGIFLVCVTSCRMESSAARTFVGGPTAVAQSAFTASRIRILLLIGGPYKSFLHRIPIPRARGGLWVLGITLRLHDEFVQR